MIFHKMLSGLFKPVWGLAAKNNLLGRELICPHTHFQCCNGQQRDKDSGSR